ncbi:uncharacterized protein LOC142620718 [Castanea sativa]|uniref:uncharacterized protein LOC142620718 n=1 Tax=Castanea sativa TaxID=21020 RepID=UPI003F649FFF
MDPMVEFLAENLVLEDKKEAARVRRIASWYWLFVNRKLYRRSFEGPYPQCNWRFVLVAMDYFTKWVEAEAMANIRDVDVKKFAEATNKAIINGLKKRLEGAKGKWAEELPSVLWAYRITLRRSTRETPFSLTFGAKAVIPAEVNLCSARVTRFAPAKNEKLMFKQLNLLEEHREAATIRLAEYQQKLT